MRTLESFTLNPLLNPSKLAITADYYYPSKRYFIFDKPVASAEFSEELQQFFDGKTPTIAKVGDDAVINLNEYESIIFRNTDPTDLRKSVFNDAAAYNYKLAFVKAEFHTYMKLTNKETNKSGFVGMAQTPKGSKWAKAILRNDSYYEAKYFKGHIKHAPGELNYKTDQGSFAVEFDITAEQTKIFTDKINLDNKRFNGQDAPWYNYDTWYSFLGVAGKNCDEYAQEVYEALKLPFHFYNYAKIDETDLKDKGVQYLIWDTLGASHISWNNFHYDEVTIYASETEDAVLTKEYDTKDIHLVVKNKDYKSLADLVKTDQLNQQNNLGNTALHDALVRQDYTAANILLEAGADANIKNKGLEIPLHICAGNPKSHSKNLILKALIKVTTDVNEPDLHAINTPLTMAVKANDKEAFDILTNAKANVTYINGNKDSMLDVALYSDAKIVYKAIYTKAPELLCRVNLEYQTPACKLFDKEEMHQCIDGRELICKSDYELLNGFDEFPTI